MSHPACCPDPDTCQLAYVEHLRGFVIGAAAIPSRAVNRTPGQPDEPATRTHARERRWQADHDAYRTLRRSGHRPKSIAGSAARVRELGG